MRKKLHLIHPGFPFSRKAGHSVLRQWILSYILILILPLLLGIANAAYARRVISEELQRANQMTLEIVSDTFENAIDVCQSTCSMIYLDERFKKMLNSPDYDASFLRSAQNLNQVIVPHVKINNGLSILIYFERQDYIVTGRTANTRDALYRALLAQNQIYEPASQWGNMLRSRQPDTFFSPEFSYNYYGKDALVCSLHVQPVSGTHEAHIYVSFNIDSILKNETDYWVQSMFAVTDADGRIIKCFGCSDERWLGMTLTPETNTVSLDGTDYIVMTTNSRSRELRYYSITDKTIYQARVSMITLFTTVITLAALIAGLILAYVLARRNYHPLSNVMRIIDETGASPASDEYERIGDAYGRLLSEYGRMKRTVNSQAELIKQHYILSLLKGRGRPMRFETIGDQIAPSFAGTHFIVAILSFGDQYDPSMMLEDVFAVYVLEDRSSYYMVDDGEYRVFLANFTQSQYEAWQADSGALIEKLMAFYQNKLNIAPIIAISSAGSSLQSTASLYAEAQDAMEYAYLSGENIVFASELQNPYGSEHSIQAGRRLALETAFERGNSEDVRYVVQSIIDSTCANSTLPFKLLRFRFYDIMDTMLDIYCQYFPENAQRIHALPLDAVTASNDIDSLRTALLNVAEAMCHSSKLEAADGLARQIREIIDTDYADSQLNIAFVAKQLNLTPKYISRVFRTETGIGILEYIGRVRVEHAEQLIQAEHITQEEAAERVGYASLRSFQRALKRQYDS